MEVHYNIKDLPAFKNTVITIGSFDGVHQGHFQILNQVREKANQMGGDSVVITFYPHPKIHLGNLHKSIRILNTTDEKSQLLEKAGIQHLVVVPFTDQFAEMTAEEYVRDFLVNMFHPSCIVVGYDHRFGRQRQGDFTLLTALAPAHGFEVIEIAAHLTEHITISSTTIREKLTEGDVETANQLLGYPYFFTGTVIKGQQIGRTIGFPTANLEPVAPEKLIPGNGVYSVDVRIGSETTLRKGMMNIGVRPTINEHSTVIEVHILEFDASLYDEKLTVYFKTRIRDEKKFSNLEGLRSQLEKDRLIASKL